MDVSRLRRLGIILSFLVALCGMIQLYLMNINSMPPLLWTWNILAVIGFLMGIARYKIFDFTTIDITKWTLFIGILLILNLLDFFFTSSLTITDMESVLASGFVLTLGNFEESTYYILSNFRERTDDNATSS